MLTQGPNDSNNGAARTDSLQFASLPSLHTSHLQAQFCLYVCVNVVDIDDIEDGGVNYNA
jgi:hypothetical protein